MTTTRGAGRCASILDAPTRLELATMLHEQSRVGHAGAGLESDHRIQVELLDLRRCGDQARDTE